MVFHFAASLFRARLPPPIDVVALIVIRSISVVVPPIPGFPLDLLTIHTFGPLFGLVIGESGIMFGATVAFSAARITRRIFEEQPNPRLLRLQVVLDSLGSFAEHQTETAQFRSWFAIRLLTNPLFDPICYAAGLTSTSFRPFFLGTLLGNLPSMTVFYFLEASSLSGMPLLLASAVFFISMWMLAERWLLGHERQTEPDHL